MTNTKSKITKDRSTQQLILLLLSGIEPNPGPRQPRFPCTISQKACKTESIACDDCDKWTHRKCIGMSTTEFSNLGKSDETWTCPSCSLLHVYFFNLGMDTMVFSVATVKLLLGFIGWNLYLM